MLKEKTSLIMDLSERLEGWQSPCNLLGQFS